MDYLRRLLFNTPTALFDLPDGVYGDVDEFLSWLEKTGTSDVIRVWEMRQRTTLESVIRGIEKEIEPLDASCHGSPS